MSWNLNSIAKDNFQRVNLIEAHNSLFKYDLISICETGLNDSVELPEPLLNEYIFVPDNNPANKRHGGAGLFFRNSLPIICHFNRANLAAIKRSMHSFPWLQKHNLNTDANWQVKTFTDIFLNIMSNFIPNETKRFISRDPPWITNSIKTLLNKKNRLFKNY